MKIGIPKGLYCHDTKWRTCIHWQLIPNLPYQENGYCWLIDKSDWDINEEANPIEVTRYENGIPHKSLEDSHIYRVSLLWDKCKECNYN